MSGASPHERECTDSQHEATAEHPPLRNEVVAETKFGRLSFALPSDGPLDAVGLALAMERCEPLIQALEDWLGCAVDPAPVQGVQPTTAGMSGVVRDASLALPGTVCRLPWAALARQAPPDVLRDQIDWERLQWRLEIARYATCPIPPDALGNSGVLLLPPSFSPPWVVIATEHTGGLAVEFEWHTDRNEFIACGTPRLPHDEGMVPGSWHVLLEQTFTNWPSDLTLGWRGQTAFRAEVGAFHQARLQGASGLVLAQGCIVPALQGAALLVSCVETPSCRSTAKERPGLANAVTPVSTDAVQELALSA